MNGIFYRVHRTADGILPFSADNAYSSYIDIPRNETGTKSECQECRGNGRTWDTCLSCNNDYTYTDPCSTCDNKGGSGPCEPCNGTGWEDCLRGYSCFAHPDQLLDYFLAPSHPFIADSEPTIIFEGHEVGTGPDWEPLVIPNRVVETLNWGEFRARYDDA
ncbi:hypothetical protein [Streptomyces anulatus]|uniref:hypothetical protein n=1 Tax=Streptomyces anulatus TaxID=1892 RepID=UPI002E0E3EA4|nr:hypothetical protein OG557_39070 [Streptomyces anulatus]